MANEQGDVKAAIEAVERLGGSSTVTLKRGAPDEASAVVLPAGKQLHSIKRLLDEYRSVPERKTGTTTLTTLDSFCEFVNRHKTSHSVIFVDDVKPDQPTLHAIFNPHKAEKDSLPAEGIGPDNQDHRAMYCFPLSDEWKAWTGLPATFSQADFAYFLEDRITDVVIAKEGGEVAQFAKELGLTLATPARLIELSKGLALSVNGRFEQKVNTGSGEGMLTWQEEHRDESGAPLKVPGAFAISIPVFRLQGHYQMPVRLRFRVGGDKKVSWMLSPQRLDKALEYALEGAEEKVAASCELPVFRGKP